MHPILLAQVGMASVLAVAAVAKLAHPADARDAVVGVGVPVVAVRPASIGLPAVELVTAVTLVAGPVVLGALMALVLAVVFDFAIAVRVMRGGACRCFGAFGSGHARTAMARNAVLSLAALMLWSAAQTGRLVPIA